MIDPSLDRAPPPVKLDPFHPEELRLIREHVCATLSLPQPPAQHVVTDGRWLATVREAELRGVMNTLAVIAKAIERAEAETTSPCRRVRDLGEILRSIRPEDVLR